jgi:Cof subfamily protein (haloacid dehalogenase superfamily)
MGGKQLKMIVIDYDGTLAASNSLVSNETIKSLKNINNKNIIRVINTGRSLFSLKTVINDDFPVDYVIFSAGIGVCNWKTKQILQANQFSSEETVLIYNFLCQNNFDFMVQLPVPDNHYFHHFGNIDKNQDFKTRIDLYTSFGVKPCITCPKNASQFVVICPENNDYFKLIKDKFASFNVVKATSPINNKSIWVEILPKNVSKASGIELIMKRHNVSINNVVAIGNDYYDLDMLEFVNYDNAYVVSNAPEDLKSKFQNILSNDQNGVKELIDTIF